MSATFSGIRPDDVRADGRADGRAASAGHAARVVLTLAGLTVREVARRRVLRSLGALTVVLLGLSGWGFSRLTAVDAAGALTSGEARLVASIVLNLVMFGLSLIAALGTTFVAGPTLAGEIESGMALSVLARPVRRSTVLVGKWLGLAAFGAGYVVVAGLALLVVVQVTVGYWPPHPATGLALLAAQTTVLMTLGLLLSTVISPMASGIVAVGLFGATWIAGVVGNINAGGPESIARIGTVSRMLLPTDGLWRGAMNAFQDSAVVAQLGGPAVEGGVPFLSASPLTVAYLAWAVLWVVIVLGLAGVALQRRDL